MSFFRLRTLPGCRWPSFPDARIAQVWNAYQQLERTQWLCRTELEERQLAQVRELLSHCVVNVPYYREVLSKAGIVPMTIRTMDDFRRIPLLPRRTYQANEVSFIARQLPAGTVATETTQTSGSSGTPTNSHQ